MYFRRLRAECFCFFMSLGSSCCQVFFYAQSRILVSLIEMLVVLLIISILLLLFVPNLSKQKDSVKETGNAAVVKVVDSQAELYEMKNNKTASLAALVSEGQITQKQADSYNDYYAKHGGESRSVAN
nr:MAG TPA: competence protein [Caudoviricetes sp.]DAL27741.1 MAG TPA_asm: competence protein [Caudoviricetes sp.]